MTETKIEQQVTGKKPFFSRDIALWQAGVILVASLLVAVIVLTAVGRQYFRRPAIATPRERGLAYYQAMVDRDPQNPSHWVDLGWYYYLEGDFDKALEQHLHALQLDPDHFGVTYNLGLTYLQVRDIDAAAEYLEKATQINDEYWEAYLALGVAYINLEQWDEAETALARSLELHQFSADTYFYLGYAAEQQGRTAVARELYEEALRFDPDFHEARDGLARVEQDS